MKLIFERILCGLRKRKLILADRNNCFGRKVFFDNKTTFDKYINIENNTTLLNCQIGKGTDLASFDEFSGCKIGRYCVVGDNCKNIVGHHPTMFYVAMNSRFYRANRKPSFTEEDLYVDEYKFADRDKEYYNIIGNDVYLTNDVTILEGVKIGDGAVITPGSVVTKNVPPYAIVRGNPAKVETYRFSPDEIEFLMNLQWWNKDEEWIKKHIHLFSNIKKLKKAIENTKKV